MKAAPHESRSNVSPMQVSPNVDERSRVCFPPRAEFGRAPLIGSKRCSVVLVQHARVGARFAGPAAWVRKTLSRRSGKAGIARTGIRARWRQCNQAVRGERSYRHAAYNGVSQSEGRQGRHRNALIDEGLTTDRGPIASASARITEVTRGNRRSATRAQIQQTQGAGAGGGLAPTWISNMVGQLY
jgi:hypothetical protein